MCRDDVRDKLRGVFLEKKCKRWGWEEKEVYRQTAIKYFSYLSPLNLLLSVKLKVNTLPFVILSVSLFAGWQTQA